jgi:hypothetical protein
MRILCAVLLSAIGAYLAPACLPAWEQPVSPETAASIRGACSLLKSCAPGQCDRRCDTNNVPGCNGACNTPIDRFRLDDDTTGKTLSFVVCVNDLCCKYFNPVGDSCY